MARVQGQPDSEGRRLRRLTGLIGDAVHVADLQRQTGGVRLGQRAAREAGAGELTTELDDDDGYSFEEAWDGARIAWAEGAAAVGKDAVEAAISATAARVTRQTGSDLAGRAAAHEARPGALKWAADLIRARIPADAITASTEATLGSA